MARRYAGDPRWISARFPSTCSARDCAQPIARGERAYYYPNGRHIFAAPCGHAEQNARDFEELAAAEEWFA